MMCVGTGNWRKGRGNGKKLRKMPLRVVFFVGIRSENCFTVAVVVVGERETQETRRRRR